MILTDRNVAKLPAISAAVASVEKARLSYDVYDRTRVEPTDTR